MAWRFDGAAVDNLGVCDFGDVCGKDGGNGAVEYAAMLAGEALEGELAGSLLSGWRVLLGHGSRWPPRRRANGGAIGPDATEPEIQRGNSSRLSLGPSTVWRKKDCGLEEIGAATGRCKCKCQQAGGRDRSLAGEGVLIPAWGVWGRARMRELPNCPRSLSPKRQLLELQPLARRHHAPPTPTPDRGGRVLNANIKISIHIGA